ncbi:RNA-directed DNA polymerase from mobile element jockey [Plakobranchus ocellatus]|uniref:RNA-directed DNA polymerase from mobile element jockey n=1 Tax=Plakobranchus ocellatus TaxID=259542 RepID=A0AAV3ZAU2_9GAST|nr:RNA-directed DNA polymerase from mobile element jockey [Plakobranchus ocellatus]
MTELKNSVNKSNESAGGPVYYQFVRHLPESCLHTLLKLFNNIWTTGDIPPSWKEASLVPIPKFGKDLSDPYNYRPIALTSCLCKTLERTVNGRLVHVLESKNLVSKVECGFRKDHSTLDHLCLKALNLLRVVGHTDWGADRATLLKLYRTQVRSKLDYGSVVYGSAKKHVLRALGPIHHQGLRIALGAFGTSPIKSLYAEAGEPSLEHRRIKLAFNYVLKLKSLPRNPCHDVVFEAPLSDFSADSKSEPNLVASTFEHIKNSKINLTTIDNLYVQCPPPREEHKINVDISLTEQKKENTSEITYRKELKKNFQTIMLFLLTLTSTPSGNKIGMLRGQTSSTKCSPTWAKTSTEEAKEPVENGRRQCVGFGWATRGSPRATFKK